MSRYVLTNEAQDDLSGIRAYLIQEAGFRVARYVLAKFTSCFRGLANSPGKGMQMTREVIPPRIERRRSGRGTQP